MHLYPAIDLFEGKVVRLRQGDFSQQTIYSNHPDKTAHLSKEIQALAEQRTRAIVSAYADIVKRRKL